MDIKKYINNLLKIFALVIVFIGFNTVISKAAIHSTDPTAKTNSTVSITITSDQALDNFNIDVTNSGGLTFASVSTKGISNGTAVGYMTLTEPLTTLATYTFKTPSSPGTYKVTFNVNGTSNTSVVNVIENVVADNTGKDDNSNTGNQTPTQTKSNIATLLNLGITPNDFSGFKANTLTYNTEVPYETEKIEIYAKKGQSAQTISGTGAKTLKEGLNTFNILVTAEDGKTQKTYTINVTRKKQEEKTNEQEPDEESQENLEEPVEVFGLTELKVEGIELKPQFQTDVYEYRIDLKEQIDKLNIETVATEVNSNIEIIGNENLSEGENIITIVVKSENEEKTATYQITVNKEIEKEEKLSNKETDHSQMIKNIILLAVGGIILIILIIVVIIKLRKNRDDSEYVTYTEFYAKDMEEIDKDEQIENNEEDDSYEESKKKKRSKGKRFK